MSMRLVPGRQPGRAHRPQRAAAARRGARRAVGHRRGDRLRPRPRHGPPRRQDGQHPARARRRVVPERLRARAPGRHARPHPPRRLARHRRVRVAGAGRGRARHARAPTSTRSPSWPSRPSPAGRRSCGASRAPILLAHVRDPVPDAPREVRPGLPPAVDEALARGLAKDPPSAPRAPASWSRRCAEALDGAPEPARRRCPRWCAAGAVAAVPADADDDPWDAALARFADLEPTRTAADSPHPGARRCAGGAARSSPAAIVLTAAAVAGALLLIGVGVGGWLIGSSQRRRLGGRGARVTQEGASRASSRASPTGAPGPGRGAQGRQGRGPEAGSRRPASPTGKAQGLAEGRTEGRAAGHRRGPVRRPRRARPGGWYVVHVGCDGAGPVVSSPTSVSTDASQCYTVSGGTVLSGPC